jgi:hypothetical protein
MNSGLEWACRARAKVVLTQRHHHLLFSEDDLDVLAVDDNPCPE